AHQLLVRSGQFRVLYASAAQIPHLLREIGRLREIAFRAAGEGSGRALDLDEFDLDYDHLFLWNDSEAEVVGAYRIGRTDEITKRCGRGGLYTSTLFEYGSDFLDRLGPALEMGRAFVRPEHQKAISPLFLLWKGIAQYVLRYPQYRMLFGTVSISDDYNCVSKQLMVEFLKNHCYLDHLSKLISPRTPFRAKRSWLAGGEALPLIRDVGELSAVVSDIEVNSRSIPVLLRQYLKLGGRLLGFNLDPNFGDSLD